MGTAVKLDSEVDAKPEFHGGVFGERFDLRPQGLALLLAFGLIEQGSGARHAQMKVQFVQVADDGGVAQFDLQLLLDPAMHLDAGSVLHGGLTRVFEPRHEDVLDALQADFAPPATSGLAHQRVDATCVVFEDRRHGGMGSRLPTVNE